MNTRTAALLLAVGSLLFYAPVALGEAGWISIGPYGASINVIAPTSSTPMTLYVGTIRSSALNGGVLRIGDGDAGWALVSSSLPSNSSVLALALDPTTPSTLYAGTSHGGTFILRQEVGRASCRVRAELAVDDVALR